MSSAPDVLDLRLCLPAALAWIAVAAALPLAHAGTALAGGLLAPPAGLVALMVLRRRKPFGRALLFASFGVALGLVLLSAHQERLHASAPWHAAVRHETTELDLTVRADPAPLTSTGLGGQARVSVQAGFPGGRALIIAAADGWTDVLPGQRVRVSGSLKPSQRASDLAITVYEDGPPRLLGRPPWYQRLAGLVRARLRAASAGLPVQARGLLPGLIDGDTTGLDPVLREHFRLAGLTHLVAVSGTNLSILIGAALLVLRRARARPWVCAAGGLLLVLVFVIIARPSPSVLRAAVMGTVGIGGLATGRPKAALPAVGLAVLALLTWDPRLAVDAGFAMSVLATAALMILAPPWAAALRRRRVPPLLSESVAVAAAAHLVTAPVIAGLSGRISLAAIPANILAEPVVAPATVLGFAAAALAPVWLGAARLLTWLAQWPCRWLIAVADHLGTVHGASVPWPAGNTGAVLLAAATLGALLLLRRAPWRLGLGAVAIVTLAIQIPVRSVVTVWPPPGWTFVACDVGQGDGLALNAGPHAAVVIDTGPDPVAMDRCLHDLGISRIPLLVLTHFHQDHVGGIAGALRGRSVGEVLASPLPDPDGGVQEVVGAVRARGLPLLTPVPGAVLTVGPVRIEVLGPVATLHETHSDPNNNSLVLRATVGATRILLPGDSEKEEQQELLDARVDLTADVLKVPHHGSAYQQPAFLAAVHASVAIVSCGLHNDYGHPSATLLREMARLGVPLRRTDLDGDVAVRGPPDRLEVTIRGKRASAVGS